VQEFATLTCRHCGGVEIKNPLRTRERGFCHICYGHLCDACKLASLQGDYVHRSWKQIEDMVTSGRYTMSGDISAPLLVPRKSDG
jgi:hypothetical protein